MVKGVLIMAKGKTTITKGVRYTDSEGKKHLLNREEFRKLMEKLNRRAKAIHNMRVVEQMETGE